MCCSQYESDTQRQRSYLKGLELWYTKKDLRKTGRPFLVIIFCLSDKGEFIVISLSAKLLLWYKEEKRDLPWRRDGDPYKIWVSEIMLQQTRVDTVIPYFQKFLARFPSVTSLAEADEEEVLTYWQGLGYYSRVRNLHKGARQVAAEYGGTIPDSLSAIKKLSGIGDYTAGAILSIAHNAPCPAVDGNVLRVFSRLYCLTDDITTAKAKKNISKIVQKVLPSGKSGDFNQAVMDLGATVCTPTNPRCSSCPLATDCQAYRENRVADFPVKRSARPPRPVQLAVGLLEHDGKILIRRRPAKGLLASMWEFPSVEYLEQDKMLAREDLRQVFVLLGLDVTIGPVQQKLTHTFSHLKWFMTVYKCTLLEAGIEVPSPWRWVEKEMADTITWAGPHAKIF